MHHKAPHIVRGNSCVQRFLTRLSFPANSVFIFIFHCKRNVETASASAPKASSPHVGSPNQATTPTPAPAAASLSTPVPATAPPENKDIESFDEFDPRASFSGKWTYFDDQQANYTYSLFG